MLEAAEPPHASTPLFDVPTTADASDGGGRGGRPVRRGGGGGRTRRPTEIVGYASVVGRLARTTLDGELDIRPARVSTNSEPLSEEDRDAIAAAWDAPIHNLWGSTEIGVQAVGCGHGEGLHVCEDEVVLERVDGAGNPVAPDEPAARTLATGLANRTFPFIRYDLGDEVTLLRGRLPVRKPAGPRRRYRGAPRRRLRLRRADRPGERVSLRARHRPADLRVPGAPDRAAAPRCSSSARPTSAP